MKDSGGELWFFNVSLAVRQDFRMEGRKMDQQLIEKVMKQVSDELASGKEECKAEAPKERMLRQ